MLEITPDPQSWNELVAGLPGGHVLQTSQWAQVKAAGGWDAHYLTWPGDGGQTIAAALVLERALSLRGLHTGLKVLYIPRGPLLDWSNPDLRRQVLDDIQAFARRRRAIFIKIDPEVVIGRGIPGSENDVLDPTGQALSAELNARGWTFSPDQIQFRNTAMLDLDGGEADWLARMKQKTRYNIRLAERKGVSVRKGGPQDFPLLYRMYAETSLRDGFVIRPESYYTHVWQAFSVAGMADALIAEAEGEAIAGLFLFHLRERAWYLYGMSRNEHRERMPNYLLQWEAMRLASQCGANVYDLWGAPDEFDESDSMWGVFRFKDGLGARVVRTLGAWDFPVRPVLYRMYTRVLPEILNVMRRRGRQRTRQEVTI